MLRKTSVIYYLEASEKDNPTSRTDIPVCLLKYIFLHHCQTKLSVLPVIVSFHIIKLFKNKNESSTETHHFVFQDLQ